MTHYNQLSDRERNAVDLAFQTMHTILRESGMRIWGDETKPIIDSIAKGILDTRAIDERMRKVADQERLLRVSPNRATP